MIFGHLKCQLPWSLGQAPSHLCPGFLPHSERIQGLLANLCYVAPCTSAADTPPPRQVILVAAPDQERKAVFADVLPLEIWNALTLFKAIYQGSLQDTSCKNTLWCLQK